MSKEEILEGNKLIAEFMDEPEWCNEFNVLDVKYHSSWDWLMPVVEKIAKSKYPIYLYFSHIQNSCIVHELNNDIAIIRESESSRLESPLLSAYKAVIEFIKWHNQILTK